MAPTACGGSDPGPTGDPPVSPSTIASTVPSPPGATATDPVATTSTTPTADPTLTTATAATTGTSAPDVTRPEGFELARGVVTPPAGASRADPGDDDADASDDPCEVCLWIADEGSLRGRGLMGVTDLGPADGMAFVYDAPRTTSFTMRNTLIPLTIVFYGPDGSYLDGFDMEPCTAEPCPSYPTPDGFTVAVEVPRGDAAGLGLVPGSRLAVRLEEPCA